VNSQLASLLSGFLYVLIIAIIIRSLLTWFPNSQNNQFSRVLTQLTDPLLLPVRRLMPRTMMIDFSPMVVILVLYLMISVVKSAAGS
jgi:YggT family protein